MFECGTSVGGCEGSGFDTPAFVINPDAAAPVQNTSTTWSRVKRVFR